MALCASEAGSTLEGSYVVFAPNAHNQPRPKTFREDIEFNELAGLVQALQRTGERKC